MHIQCPVGLRTMQVDSNRRDGDVRQNQGSEQNLPPRKIQEAVRHKNHSEKQKKDTALAAFSVYGKALLVWVAETRPITLLVPANARLPVVVAQTADTPISRSVPTRDFHIRLHRIASPAPAKW
jgi:hypothetical protein